MVCPVNRIDRKPERREKMSVVYFRAASRPVILCYPDSQPKITVSAQGPMYL